MIFAFAYVIENSTELAHLNWNWLKKKPYEFWIRIVDKYVLLWVSGDFKLNLWKVVELNAFLRLGGL